MYNMYNLRFNMFNIFEFLLPIMFILVFTLVLALFIFAIATSLKSRLKNQKFPTLTVSCKVVAKREYWGSRHNEGRHYLGSYFATFEFDSGDRLELQVPHDEFGYLVEGDYGKLTFKGTKFISFQREQKF